MTQRKASAKKSPDTIRGAYVGHPRGFGFLVQDSGGADLFVPPNSEGDAIDGDKVEAVRGDRGTARVTRVIARGRKLLVGTHLGNNRFATDAHRIPQSLKVDGKARRGDKVLVETTKTKLRIRRVLGRAGDPAVENNAGKPSSSAASSSGSSLETLRVNFTLPG